MIDEQRPYLSYLLRLWQERATPPEVWRASLENSHTGELIGFADTTQLFEFLKAQVAEETAHGAAIPERRQRHYHKTQQAKGDTKMTAIAQEPKIDEAKLNAVIGQVVSDFGAIASSALMVLGDKLGLYKAMDGLGATTSEELAKRTGTTERYVRDWLVNQASSGYISYDPQSERYTLPPESALALARENNPYFVVGGFELFLSMIRAEPEILEAFKTGGGLSWGDHDHGLFVGTERFFRPGYIGNLVANWLPALDGVVPKLQAGGKVADVGCGHGASTIIMAQNFPNSRFWGFDDHAPSIERARQEAAEAGVADRVTFEVAGAQNYPQPEGGYDLVAFFDCLHDMGDPIGAVRHTAEVLAPGGTAMIVEPMAGERVEENLNPVGRIYSAASVMLCTPNAVATGNTHLGTIATETVLRTVVHKGGLSRFRRVTETPFNRIFEARL